MIEVFERVRVRMVPDGIDKMNDNSTANQWNKSDNLNEGHRWKLALKIIPVKVYFSNNEK